MTTDEERLLAEVRGELRQARADAAAAEEEADALQDRADETEARAQKAEAACAEMLNRAAHLEARVSELQTALKATFEPPDSRAYSVDDVAKQASKALAAAIGTHGEPCTLPCAERDKWREALDALKAVLK